MFSCISMHRLYSLYLIVQLLMKYTIVAYFGFNTILIQLKGTDVALLL